MYRRLRLLFEHSHAAPIPLSGTKKAAAQRGISAGFPFEIDSLFKRAWVTATREVIRSLKTRNCDAGSGFGILRFEPRGLAADEFLVLDHHRNVDAILVSHFPL